MKETMNTSNELPDSQNNLPDERVLASVKKSTEFLSKMTKRELHQLERKIHVELEKIETRTKKPVYEIDCEGTSWAFKDKSKAIEKIIEMANENMTDFFLAYNSKVTIKTTLIDEAEYDQYGDEWLWT